MDLDTLLRETSAVPGPGSATLAAGRRDLEGAALAAGRVVAVRSLRRRRARRVALTALVATAASAALVLAPTLPFGGSPGANADAAQVLLRAGAAAGAQQGDWRTSPYWRSVSTYVRDGQQVRREIWIGHHAPGVLRDPGVDAGLIPLEVAAFPTGGSSVTWDELWALPTDRAALERRLRAGIHGAGPDDDSELYTIVGDLLRESPAPPALRRALWEVAAEIPGIELVGAVTDGAGRAGMAVERHGERYVLDPDDGRLLEETSSGWRVTYLEQGPADSAPQATGEPASAKG